MTCLPPRRCGPSGDEEGSVVLGIGLMAIVCLLGVAVAAVGAAVAAHGQAGSAADAAALAAAPVTFAAFGAQGTPAQEAARFASLNGARLESCLCRVDRSFSKRTVVVEVSRSVGLPGLGWIRVRAESRATFEPAALIPSD